MAGRPLRMALSFIVTALLAAAASAGSVKSQTGRGGTSGTSGAGPAGAVGSPAPGAATVSGAMSLDLAGSITNLAGGPGPTYTPPAAVMAPAAPASVLAAAADAPVAAAAPQPTHAQIKAALNPPPGYAGHNYNHPVFWPKNVHAFLHEPADKLAPQTFAGIVDAYQRTFGAAGSALDALASGQTTAEQTYAGAKPLIAAAPVPASVVAPAKPVFGKKGLAPASSKPAPPPLTVTAQAPDIEPRAPAQAPAAGLSAPAGGPAGAASLRGAGLSPFEASGVSPLLPPDPPLGEKISGWFASKWSSLLGKKTPPVAAKAGRAAQPPPAAVAPAASGRREDLLAGLLPETAPLLPVRREPLETDRGLLVHAPRAARRDALGFRVHLLGLAAEDGAASVRDEAVRVRVDRIGDAAATAALRERHDAFDRLVENNFAALELMARSAGQITVKTARALFRYAEAMSKDYGALVDRGESSDVAFGLAEIGVGFETGVREAGLVDGDLLTPALWDLVMPIERKSVHRYINRIHQGALEGLGKGGAAAPNLRVVLDGRVLELADISERPLVERGRIVSPGFRALVGAMTRAKDVPNGALVMKDHQFQGHFKLGAHSAQVYANFLPPDEGGMIRVRYQEWGTGYDNQTRLYYVARLLQKTGFHVEQENGFLTAVVDKDHAAQSADQMAETFALVVQALHATVGVDFALPMLVAGSQTSEEVGRRIDGWVDVVLAEGTLPFYAHDDQQAMLDGWRAYMDAAPARARLRAALDARLLHLGLPPIPREAVMGQRTIDRFVNEAVEKAVARGQLRLNGAGRLVKTQDYGSVSRLAQALEGHELTASRMAEVVSSLDPTLFDYETVGSLGALIVERAQRRLDPDAWLTVHVLRDPKTGQVGFARAEIAVLEPGASPRPLSPESLFDALQSQGLPVARFKPSETPPGRSHFMRLLRQQPEPEPDDRMRFMGLPASPAHGRPVTARVTYDKAKAAQGGFIFVAPYTTPDDIDAIKASKAVLTTAGGLLSHAAITTREMGIPASILTDVLWQGGAAALERRLYSEPFAVGGLTARSAGATPRRVSLPEGAVVRLDPGTGAIEVFPAGTSAALLDAAAALERYDADGDGQAFAAWLLKRADGTALTDEQKALLAREALSGMAARSMDRPQAASALSWGRQALARAGQTALAERESRRAFAALQTRTLYAIAEARMQLAAARSVESVDRLRRRAASAAERLGAAGAALGRPKEELARLGLMASAADKEAAQRTSALLAEEMAELREHAARYPSATMETLPLMKAAIAKAKRRGFAPEVVSKWEAQVRGLEAAREAAMKAEKPLLLPLRDVVDADVAAVGGKAAKLGEIAAIVEAAGGVVPRAVAPTVHAYRAFLREAGILEALEAVASDPALSPEQRSGRARRLIMGAHLARPGEPGGQARLREESGVGRAILDALRRDGLDGVMLAVRSSAVDEDGAEAAFAGAGETHLYVSFSEVLAHVQEIWASVWNARSLIYRRSKGLSTANLAQAVVLQEMVDAEVAGVAFTQDPVTGDNSRLLVAAAYGLGEGVVSDRVTADQYTVGKDLGIEVLPPIVGDKKLAIIRSPDGRGTVEQKMPAEWRRRRSMTPDMLARLNKVAGALERHFGYPLDVEFAFSQGKLYILQARPVTTAAAQPAAAAAPDAAKAKTVLFVCTGNTCRSPMAEQLARARLAQEGRGDIAVASRGLGVGAAGAAMSAGAQATLSERGLDGSLHAARALTDQDVAGAEVILAMTREHAAEILRRHPGAKGKVHALADYTGKDVADPYGGDLAAYRSAADAIEDALAVLVPAR
ncbi:MAG: PEP/pyruvate-binding domain-containing protein [Elusimicrobiota bacterium]|nr:PEP/pyruvate-binding domain-containing protein [Elusimicrobiota bacterium]